MTPLPPQVWVPPTTTALLDRAVAARPLATALIAGDLALSYSAYGDAVKALAHRLAAHGVAGGTVAILLRNSAAAAITLFAVQYAGAATAALNPDYTARELAPMLQDAAPRVLIAHADTLACLAGIVPEGCVVIIVGTDADFLGDLRGSLAAGPTLPVIDPDALAVLQFTGGTTGRAKGVELTHRAVATNIAQREAVLPTQFGDERILCMMPMYHSFAAAMCLHLAAYAAATLVILPRYRPDWVVAALQEHRITRLPAGPTVFNGLLAFDGFGRAATASLRCCYSGSAPLAVDTLARWEALTGVPIFEGYGQSEAGPILTYQGPAHPRKQGSVGRALPLTLLRVVDPLDPNREPAQGETGEIIAQGPQIMRGYRGLPETTAETLREGWLHTGDIGWFDEDGDLFIADRKKDMVITGGFNVYPREIDEVLALQPGVAAAAAVGIADAYRGEVIVAFVEAAAGHAVDAAQLLAHCAANLVKYKHPVRFHVVDALPRTPVGKIDKAALRVMAAHQEVRADAG